MYLKLHEIINVIIPSTNCLRRIILDIIAIKIQRQTKYECALCKRYSYKFINNYNFGLLESCGLICKTVNFL